MNSKKEEKDLKDELTKEIFKDESLSDESLDNAFSTIREKKLKTGHKVEDDKQSILALSKTIMRKNLRRKRRKIMHLSLTSTFITLATSVLICFLCLRIPENVIDFSWKSMLQITQVDYSLLSKVESTSIHKINKDKNAEFYWLDNLKRTSTNYCYFNNEIVMIEESYIYETIPCTIYITNKNTKINGVFFLFEDNFKINHNNLFIFYLVKENELYCRFYKDFNYVLKISSKDVSFLEPIIINLTQE